MSFLRRNYFVLATQQQQTYHFLFILSSIVEEAVSPVRAFLFFRYHIQS